MKLRSFPKGLLFSAALAFSATLARAEGLQPNDTVAICGDSITEQKLYSVFMEDYLLMCQPAPKLQTVQFGWSGETAQGFLARLKNDVLAFKPTVATTCYGMNDGGYAALAPERATLYKTSMEGIVKTFKENGVRFLVVGSPGAVDTDSFKKLSPDVYNKTLSELTAIAREVAEKNGCAFANVHDVMVDVMAKAKAKYGKTYIVGGGDGIHPGANGHIIMAYAFLKALGCSGDIGTITLDLKSGSADATEGHKVLSAKDGTVEVESSRYPFCFTGTPTDPTGTIGITEFLPFNQDLNRFILVVKNAPAGQLKVTWGTESKTFSSADLEKGINLAAEFPQNPFSKPFATVEAVIREQQIYETPATKSMMHSLLDWRKNFPENEDSYKKMADKIVQKDVALREATAKAIVPVKHTITVEAVK
ncbi:SGNH/GDSL hydrolase family protein [soil metagenome]